MNHFQSLSKRLNLKYDEPLSNFALNSIYRPYMKWLNGVVKEIGTDVSDEVGQCGLTLSKPELKARLGSALET